MKSLKDMTDSEWRDRADYLKDEAKNNPLHEEPEDDACCTCGGQECIMNQEYLVWEENEGERLPWDVQNDSRRHGLLAERAQWDEEVHAPPRYLPCPACHTLAALDASDKRR